MNDMMNPKRRVDRNSRRSEGEESENSFFEGDGSSLFVEREEWEDDREFSDVFPDELHDALPPLCDIQHHIDLEIGSQLPNMPHDRMSPIDHEELLRQNFVKGFPYHGESSDDDLAGNSRMNFVYPWGNDEGPSIEERALLFLEAQDRVKEKAKKFRDA
nr:putative reverse transcriptase domain-containing protein [Tanacetum cinerariifolium]